MSGLKKLSHNLHKYCLPAVGILMFTVVGFIAYKFIQAHIENTTIDTLFWWKAIISYCKNIGTTLLLPVLIALLTALHSEYRKKEPKKFEFNFPIETADDYELFLENAIVDKLGIIPSLKIVTVIDDLDRLSLDKIVEALDSVKAFVNLRNCVFIVPFDDEIIKSALEKRRASQFGEDCEVIESELILDKLFQFKVYLPQLLKYDISDYAMKLVAREIPDFISDYCPEMTFNRLISRIIIHSAVSTPRQVKKLVNAFVNNYLIAREREESGRVEKGLLTGEHGLEQIAKLSVLQADFNHFYDLLFVDFSYMTIFTKIVQNKFPKSDVPLGLRRFFKFNDEDGFISVESTCEPLLNFLNRTAKFSVDNIAPFLYLAQDAISIKTGDEQQRRTIAALESGNAPTLKTLLEEKPEIAEAVISYIFDCVESELPLQATFAAVTAIDERYATKFINAIVERSIETTIDFLELAPSLSPKDVLFAAEQGGHKEYGAKLVEKYLTAIVGTQNTKEHDLINALKVFIPKYKSLTLDAQTSIKCAAKLCCTQSAISVKSVFPLLDFSDGTMFVSFWGMDWLSKLCTHISDENDYKSDVIDVFKKSFSTLIDSANISEILECVVALFALPPLLATLNELFTAELCSKLNESQSTQVADELIKHKYDIKSEPTKIIHKLLSKLNYVVDEENAETMTAFTANYATSALMDDVFVYMGKNDFFPYIAETLTQIMNCVFDDDNNDELLRKICGYLTESDRDTLFKLLAQKSVYVQNKDYIRELSVISILANENSYQTPFEKFAITTLLSQTNNNQNYYCQYPHYFEFVAQAIGAARHQLQQATIDNYVEKLVTLFAAQRAKCLCAFEQLSECISEEQFAKIFPLVTTNITDSEFEQAIKIIIDNDDVRPTENGDLSKYRDFLMSHLKKTAKPNMVLQTIRNSFGYISDIKMLVEASLGNSATDTNLLFEVVSQCFNNYESPDKIAKESLPLLATSQEFTIMKTAFGKLTKHSLDNVFAALTENLTASTSIDALVNVAEYVTRRNSMEAMNLYIHTMALGLARDNVTDKVIEIISALSHFNKEFIEPSKNTFVETLLVGFAATTSEAVQSTIIRMIRQLNRTRQAKKMLKDDEEKLELFNKLAK